MALVLPPGFSIYNNDTILKIFSVEKVNINSDPRLKLCKNTNVDKYDFPITTFVILSQDLGASEI